MFTQSGTMSINGLARLTPNGALDSTFGNGGIVVNSIPASGLDVVAIDPTDQKIVAVGVTNNNTAITLSRYLN